MRKGEFSSLFMPSKQVFVEKKRKMTDNSDVFINFRR